MQRMLQKLQQYLRCMVRPRLTCRVVAPKFRQAMLYRELLAEVASWCYQCRPSSLEGAADRLLAGADCRAPHLWQHTAIKLCQEQRQACCERLLENLSSTCEAVYNIPPEQRQAQFLQMIVTTQAVCPSELSSTHSLQEWIAFHNLGMEIRW